jgi:DNA-binding MarR family transcriptional regulator
MNARDLYLLGRRLMKLGEEAMRGSEGREVPTGLRLIVIDVAEHPGSSIGEIAARTGLPQSHVSASVARLRARGALETEGDPLDGRRKLVRLAPRIPERAARRGSVSVDEALGEAMGVTDPRARSELVAALERVLAHLRDAPAAGVAPEDGGEAEWPLEDDR